MKQIIFCGKGELGRVCLLALQEKFEQIMLVECEENRSIIELKRENDEIISNIAKSACKYVFLAGWDDIIDEMNLKEKKYVNVHGSILPKYRGLHSIYWAIMNNESQLGYTIHEVNDAIDDGDILYQYIFEYNNQTVKQVHHLFYEDLKKNLGVFVDDYINGALLLQKQNYDKATWVPRRNLQDCIIDFSMSNTMLRRFFLALTEPYPLPRIIVRGQAYEIVDSEIIDREYYCEIGRVVNVERKMVWIKTIDGFLVLKNLKNLKTEEYLTADKIVTRGYRFLNQT